jgi:hypothetical protein
MIMKQLTLALALTAACFTAQGEQSMDARFEAVAAHYINEFPAPPYPPPASATIATTPAWTKLPVGQ